MNDLITITYNENEEPVVSGRELHEKLGIDSNYTTWFNRMCEYGFEEGKDYLPILENRSDGLAGKPRTDHILTLDMAKQLCMIQRTDIGRSFREYFIEVEKAWNSDEAVMGRALKIYDRRNKALTAKNESLLADNRKLADTVDELDRQVVSLTDERDNYERLYKEYRIKNYFTDRCMEKGENLSIRDTAKELGVKETEFVKLLVERKYLYRRPHHQNRLYPYSSQQCSGVFVLKEVCFGGGLKYQSQTLVTPAGRAKLTAECVKAGLLPMAIENPAFAWEV